MCYWHSGRQTIEIVGEDKDTPLIHSNLVYEIAVQPQ